MYYYARDHIPNYQNIATYPNDIQYNPDTNGVTNFDHAFFDMNKCRDTIGSIMNRFDWNSCTDMSWAFALCYKLTGSIPNIPNSVTNMGSTFWFCGFITGHIPTIPNSVTDMSSTFQYCSNLTGSIPNIPNRVTDMSYTFSDCSKLSSSNVYIHSNNVINATSCFRYMRNIVNIYVHANTTTYNSFYKAMGRKTYNSVWNSYLKTF